MASSVIYGTSASTRTHFCRDRSVECASSCDTAGNSSTRPNATLPYVTTVRCIEPNIGGASIVHILLISTISITIPRGTVRGGPGTAPLELGHAAIMYTWAEWAYKSLTFQRVPEREIFREPPAPSEQLDCLEAMK